jgi:hypothetical protein
MKQLKDDAQQILSSRVVSELKGMDEVKTSVTKPKLKKQ